MADNLPYYPPVAPEVPVADHTAAKIIASGDLAGAVTRGFAAAAQATAQRQRLQLESEQMITDAALKSRELDIARENNKMDFQVGMKNASMVSDWNSDPNNPLGRAGRLQAKLKLEEDWVDYNKTKQKLGLNEPRPKNPVEFYRNFKVLEEGSGGDDMEGFRFSTDQRIKNDLKIIQSVTEQNHYVPIKFGRTKDEDGQWKGGTETRQVPIGQIVEGLNDPDRADETMLLLESNGHTISSPPQTQKVEAEFSYTGATSWSDSIRDWMFGPPKPEKRLVDQTVTEQTLSPSISRYRAMASGVDFSRGKSRTPPSGVVVPNAGAEAAAQSITQDSVDEAGTAIATESGASVSTPPPVTTTAPSKEALFPQTETEKILAQAKRAMAKPGANVPAIKAMLQDKYNIDPSQL